MSTECNTLSPLAYPENPCHHLVKDYQLVRDSVNDPCEGALLAGRIVALVRRYKRDIKDTVFRDRCCGESWEAPIVELVY